MKTCLEEFFNGNFLQVLPSVPVPSSPLKQGEEVLLRKKKRFLSQLSNFGLKPIWSPNFLQFWTILTIFFLQVQGSLLLPTCAWWWAGTEGISNWSFLLSQFYSPFRFSQIYSPFRFLLPVQVFTILLLLFRLIRILTSCVRWRMVGGRGGWEAE